MENEIWHHGEKRRLLGPPRNISNMATGEKSSTLKDVAVSGKVVPVALWKEIEQFLKIMDTMPEEEKLKRCYELMKKIGKQVVDDKGQN